MKSFRNMALCNSKSRMATIKVTDLNLNTFLIQTDKMRQQRLKIYSKAAQKWTRSEEGKENDSLFINNIFIFLQNFPTFCFFKKQNFFNFVK